MNLNHKIPWYVVNKELENMDTNSPIGGGNIEVGVSGSKKTRSFWKLLVALGAIIFLFVAYVIWAAFFSPQAVSERETQKNYEQAMKALSEYEEMMRNDIYGGKTPQETLDMFIDALEKEDFELASRYFIVGGKTKRERFEQDLRKIEDEGRLDLIISILMRSKPYLFDVLSDKDYKFAAFNSSGEMEMYVNMELNEYSNVWKIESL